MLTKKIMKTLLVPTDFSKTAISAFRYALSLAEKLHSTEIKLVSVYHEPINFKDSGYVPALAIEEAKQKCETQLMDLISIEQINNPSKIKVTYEALRGYASNCIMEAAENPNIDMVVMGTTGEHDQTNEWLGTVSINVAQNAKRPVLLVPTGAKYTGIEHILYACDFSQADFDIHTEGVVAKLADTLKAEVKVIFVSDGKNEYKTDQIVMRDIFKMDAPKVPLSIEVMENDSTVRAIKEFAVEKDFDLIVVATKQRGFFDELFHHSITKELIWHPNLPVLVVHAEDWKEGSKKFDALEIA
jgi:nucleotide-binding universal stress UspA family protein